MNVQQQYWYASVSHQDNSQTVSKRIDLVILSSLFFKQHFILSSESVTLYPTLISFRGTQDVKLYGKHFHYLSLNYV